MKLPGSMFQKTNSLLPWLVFAIALGLRLVYLSENLHSPFFEHPRLDGLFHDTWARSIAGGDFLGNRVFFRAPFYPYLLGLLYYVVDPGYIAPRVLQHLLGSGLVVLVFVFTRRLLGAGVALIAAMLLSLYPILIYFEGELLFESVLTFLCLSWIVVIYQSLERQSVWLWFASGLLLGLVSITRPPFLLVGIIVLVYALASIASRIISKRMLLQFWVAAFTGLFLVVGVVTTRNYYVERDFVLIASQGGINFFIGNNPGADGYSSSIPGALGPSWENRDLTYYVETQLGHRITPSEESWFWYERGFDFIMGDLGGFITLTARKAYLFWNHYEIPNNHSYYFAENNSRLLNNIPLGFGVIGPIGLVGMLLLWENKKCRPIILFVGTYFLVTIGFFVCDRFRIPIIPFLCISGSFTIVLLWRCLRSRDHRRGALIIALCLLSATLSNSNVVPIAHDGFAREYFSQGLVELEQGNATQAINNFSRAGSLVPGLPNLQLSWGVAEWLQGNEGQAVLRFNEEIALNPDSYGGFLNLSLIYLYRGSLDSALVCAKKCTTIKPYAAKGYTTLGEIYLRAGELTRADSVLSEGAKNSQQDFSYGDYLSGRIAFGLGDLKRAETIYRSLLNRRNAMEQPIYEPEFSFSSHEAVNPSLRGKIIYSLGHIFAEQGHIDSAAFYFEMATRIIPVSADVWADLGVSQLRLNAPTKAEGALKKAIQLDETHHLYWFNLGTSLAMQGKLEDAESAYRRSVALNPEFTQAREKLGIIQDLRNARRKAF